MRGSTARAIAGEECGGEDGDGQKDQPPFRGTGPVKQWPKAEDREKNAEGEAELPIGPQGDFTEACDRFMGLHQAPCVEAPCRTAECHGDLTLLKQGSLAIGNPSLARPNCSRTANPAFEVYD